MGDWQDQWAKHFPDQTLQVSLGEAAVPEDAVLKASRAKKRAAKRIGGLEGIRLKKLCPWVHFGASPRQEADTIVQMLRWSKYTYKPVADMTIQPPPSMIDADGNVRSEVKFFKVQVADVTRYGDRILVLWEGEDENTADGIADMARIIAENYINVRRMKHKPVTLEGFLEAFQKAQQNPSGL